MPCSGSGTKIVGNRRFLKDKSNDFESFYINRINVVIAIIGVLAAITMPMYTTSYSARAKAFEVPIILKDIVKFQFIHRDYSGSYGKYEQDSEPSESEQLLPSDLTGCMLEDFSYKHGSGE